MGKAKTASKNNPMHRASAKEIIYEGKKVVPVMFISEARRYMAAQFENGDMPLNADGSPLSWSEVQ
jgi:hypothetical protein